MTTAMKASMMNGHTGSSLEDASAGARRASAEASSSAAPPDPEVAAVAKRRRFSGAEKRRILGEADRCTQPGEIGALLRREGIYASMLATWRKQREQAERVALAPRKRGPKPNAALAEARQMKKLQDENARLRAQLERARTIIDVQKKLCTMLGLPTAPEADEDA
jgi:transposase